MESECVCLFECELCQKQFLTEESLLVHQRRNHRASKFVCRYCNHETNFRFALTKHIERVHLKQKFVCHYCSHKTNFKIALKKHIQRVHLKTKLKKPIKLLTCPLCNLYKCGDRNGMLEHYKHAHDVQMNETILEFNSNEDFLTWKRDTEFRDSSQFISIRGVKKTPDGSIQYLRCSRDGFYRSARKGKRRMKSKGSVKIDAVCPSSIKLQQKTSGPVRATYVGTHVGHICDVGRLQLSELERNYIAQKLAAHIPDDAILDSIRESMCDGNYSRLHLITRKDLANIKQSLHNGYSVHPNDRTSVEAWVKTVASYSNIVRFYKPQSVLLPDCDLREDDFVLILAYDAQISMLSEFGAKCVCFDGTHGTNACDFELTTLLVKDSKNQGFPCAFLISNRADTEIMTLFISVIKTLLGKPLKPNILMTDMSEVYYNAWCAVMLKPGQWLFCSWHVDRAWRKNLNKIADSNKKYYAYKLVRTLMDETDESKFEPLMEKVLQKMTGDGDLLNFANHFKQTYSASFRSWAFCYRKYKGINTNMMLESMHKVIKYIYLEGEKVKRLDKRIAALLKFVRDKLYDALIAKCRGKLTPELFNIRDSHDRSLTMKPTFIPSREGWLVSSESETEMYEIKKMDVEICDCIAKCKDCDICIHDYQCTCIDAMKSNICKHIHSLVNYIRQTTPVESDEIPGELSTENLHISPKEEDPLEMAIVDEDLSAKNRIINQPKKNLEECKRSLCFEFYNIVNSIQTFDEYADVKKSINQLTRYFYPTTAGQERVMLLPCP